MKKGIECFVPPSTRRGGFANVVAGKHSRRKLREQHQVNDNLGLPTDDGSKLNDIQQTSSTAVSSQQQLPAIFALQKELYTVNDALGILCSVASAEQFPPSLQPQSLLPASVDWQAHAPPHSGHHSVVGFAHTTGEARAWISDSHRPQIPIKMGSAHSPACNYLSTDLARSGLLIPTSISALVGLFFDRIEPFFPFIHETFYDERTLSQHEVLLWTISAISCKYSDSPTVQQVSKYLWNEAKRRISEVAYRGGFPLSGDVRLMEVAAVSASVLLTQEWTLDNDLSLEQYNQGGYGQLSMACQLAKVTGVLSRNKGLFIGLHMMDFVISCRLGLNSILELPNPSTELSKRLSLYDQARISVTCLLGYSAKSLFPSRDATRELVANGSFLILLDRIHPKFENWLEQYKEIVECDHWEARNVMFEFQHCRLYVYSLALVAQQHKLNSSGSFKGAQHQVFKYMQIAAESAASIVIFETDANVNPVGFNFAPPMRWIVRFIHATVFLSKILLSSSSGLTTQRKIEIFNLIIRAADAMEQTNANNFQLMGHLVEKMASMRDQISQLCNVKPVGLCIDPYTRFGDFVSHEHHQSMRSAASPTYQAPTAVEFQSSSQRSSFPSMSDTENVSHTFAHNGFDFSSPTMPDGTVINFIDNWELNGVDNTMIYLPQYQRYS